MQARDLPRLAGMYAAALIQHLPNGPCIIAGVGLNTMVAYELSIQLQLLDCTVELLIAFESIPITQARLALPAIDDTVTGELMQVWCGLYQLIVETSSSQSMHMPGLTQTLRHLYGLQSYEEQLEFVSTFCPADMEAHVWDSRVHETLSGVLHLMQLLHGYQPADMLHCPVLLMHSQERQQIQQGSVMTLELLGCIADDSWKQTAAALLPVTACSLPSTIAGQLSAAVAESVNAVIFEAVSSDGVGEHGSGNEQQGFSSDAQLGATLVPLNDLCHEHRYTQSSSSEC